MLGIVQIETHEVTGRAGVMIPIPGFSLYQARLLQHNSYQVMTTTERLVIFRVELHTNGVLKLLASFWRVRPMYRTKKKKKGKTPIHAKPSDNNSRLSVETIETYVERQVLL